MAHLRGLTVDGVKVRGFHILPPAAPAVTTTNPVTLPAGQVAVVDSSGVPIAGARVRLVPHRTPADGYDAFEARVEVLDAASTVIATDAGKSFYPPAWTEVQVEQAIYSALVVHYQSGGSPLFYRQVLTTPAGVLIEMRVSGSQTAAGVKLKGIPTAYPRPGQRLTAGHAP